MSQLLNSIMSGGGISLAPDLNYISDGATIGPADGISFARTTGLVDGTSGLVTAITLTGKFLFSALRIRDNISESYTIKLTVDGEVKWNSAVNLGVSANILGGISGALQTGMSTEPFTVKSSLLLETSSTTDNNYRFDYIARPIL